MDARAVVADRCADIGLERRSKREVPADTETHNTNFPWRDFRMYGKPVQASAAIGIEMPDRSLCSVLLAAGPSGVSEGDHRSRRLDAPINFRRSSNKSIPRQPHASAQQWRSELKNIRVAPNAWILAFGPGRSNKGSHRRAWQRNVSVFGSDDHFLIRAKFWPRRENRSTSQFMRRLVVDRDQMLPLHSRAVPQGCQSLGSTAIAPLPSHLRYFPERQKWPDRRLPGTCAWLLADGTLQTDVSCGLLPFPSLVSPTNSRSTGSTRKSKKAGRQVVESKRE